LSSPKRNGETIGQPPKDRNGFSAKRPSPPSTMSNISIAGRTLRASVKAISQGFRVEAQSA
jgi:hypothetical protein